MTNLPYKGGENNDESTPLPSRGGVGGGVCNLSYIEAVKQKCNENVVKT